MQQWTKDDLALLNMTNEVDYDQDGKASWFSSAFTNGLSIVSFFFAAYCQQLEDMIAEKIEVFSAIRDRARNFRKCLADEESKSRLLLHKN